MSEFLKGFGKGIKSLGESVRTVVNTTLLFIVYVIGVCITGIFAKIVGKHFLDIKTGNKSTYWRELNLKKKSIGKYYKQF